MDETRNPCGGNNDMKIPFFNRKRKAKEPESHLINVPEHIAIIMDGNGRWASKKGLPRIAGHKEGMTAVQKVVRTAVDCKVKVLTMFAFSTENWKRPSAEVEFLLRLPKEFLHIYLPELMELNVRIETLGEFDALPESTKKAINYAKDKTKDNDGLILNFALNYGSRHEIIQAIKHMIEDMDDKDIDIDTLDEAVFSKYLYTNGLGDPDLLIRTSGEQRLSNFLLWQLAYTEFWFTEVLWPDFDEAVFLEAIEDYQKRKRRYGGI